MKYESLIGRKIDTARLAKEIVDLESKESSVVVAPKATGMPKGRGREPRVFVECPVAVLLFAGRRRSGRGAAAMNARETAAARNAAKAAAA